MTISNGSCITNSLVPPLAVLLDNYGLEKASYHHLRLYLSTGPGGRGVPETHSGARGALNLVPTSTGADKEVASLLPDLAGKFSTLVVRTPIADGGLIDITVRLEQAVTEEQVNPCLYDASENILEDVMHFTLQEWVSSEMIANPHFAIVHGLSIGVIGDHTVKPHVWYDNEYAYACRLLICR